MAKNVRNKTFLTIFVIILCFSLNIIPAQAKTKELTAGGEPFGLKLYCKGVIVTKLEEFMSNGQKVCPAKESGLMLDDIITEINKKKITSNEQAEDIIKNSKGKPLTLTVLREGKPISKTLTAKLNENEYYAGMFIRDSCAGIGTISFYDTDNNVYGALGHGICDIDTGGLVMNSTGQILTADINSVDKSTDNNIGSLNGIFTNNVIGTIFENTPNGIYGTLNSDINKKTYQIADKEEIKLGKATLLTTTEGTTPKPYEIEITGICDMSDSTNKNFTVKITDEKLLSKTGGIVQGMSGSPIIQNNKIIGALTHVFLENCTEGFGVYIGNMISD